MIVDLAGVDDPRWQSALPVLRELRPNLTDELFQQVIKEGTPQGLRFTAIFDGDDDNADCVAIAGWRVVASTGVGRKLYVDDLSTAAAARSRGFGSEILSHLKDRARELGRSVLMLDSGVQRFSAHRFYLRERMEIRAHQFRMDIDPA